MIPSKLQDDQLALIFDTSGRSCGARLNVNAYDRSLSDLALTSDPYITQTICGLSSRGLEAFRALINAKLGNKPGPSEVDKKALKGLLDLLLKMADVGVCPMPKAELERLSAAFCS